MSALVQVAEDSPAETDFPDQGAVDAGNPVLPGIDRNGTLHPDQHLLNVTRRLVFRIGTELQPDQRITRLPHAPAANLGSIRLIEERTWQGFHDSIHTLGIFLLRLLLLSQFIGVV